jgi:hypothetical protein
VGVARATATGEAGGAEGRGATSGGREVTGGDTGAGVGGRVAVSGGAGAGVGGRVAADGGGVWTSALFDASALDADEPGKRLLGPAIFGNESGTAASGFAAVPRAAGIDDDGRGGGGDVVRDDDARGGAEGDGASIAMMIDRPPNPIPTAMTP